MPEVSIRKGPDRRRGRRGEETSQLARLLAEQSRWWDPTLQDLRPPEARLLFAVVARALEDLTHLQAPKPARRRYATRSSYAQGVSQWSRQQLLARDALDFLTTDRLAPYADLLGWDHQWVRRVVRRWVRARLTE